MISISVGGLISSLDVSSESRGFVSAMEDILFAFLSSSSTLLAPTGIAAHSTISSVCGSEVKSVVLIVDCFALAAFSLISFCFFVRQSDTFSVFSISLSLSLIIDCCVSTTLFSLFTLIDSKGITSLDSSGIMLLSPISVIFSFSCEGWSTSVIIPMTSISAREFFSSSMTFLFSFSCECWSTSVIIPMTSISARGLISYAMTFLFSFSCDWWSTSVIIPMTSISARGLVSSPITTVSWFLFFASEALFLISFCLTVRFSVSISLSDLPVDSSVTWTISLEASITLTSSLITSFSIIDFSKGSVLVFSSESVSGNGFSSAVISPSLSFWSQGCLSLSVSALFSVDSTSLSSFLFSGTTVLPIFASIQSNISVAFFMQASSTYVFDSGSVWSFSSLESGCLFLCLSIFFFFCFGVCVAELVSSTFFSTISYFTDSWLSVALESLDSMLTAVCFASASMGWVLRASS